tara:strand:- start:547 stop:1218 length:672 start_codon:yes stop_codon:yes gene_type:complete
MNLRLLACLIALAVVGCSATGIPLSGEAVYAKERKDYFLWEEIVVFGKLKEEVLRPPTEVYHSSFGHSYCMSEYVVYEVFEYIKGSGPKVIEFSQNTFDVCRPLADQSGFGESILFLAKNKPRGVWSNASMVIDTSNGDRRIFKPEDMAMFLRFSNFESLLRDYEKPYEWAIGTGLLPKSELEKLRGYGVLSYRLDASDTHQSIYLLEMYKYLDANALLTKNF